MANFSLINIYTV